MKTFANIFGFLRKREAEIENSPISVNENENALIVSVDKDGKAILRISLQNLENGDAESFAKALFAVQSGSYIDQISELITEIGHSENEGFRLEFVKELLGYYTIYFDMLKNFNYNKDSKPVVSPLKFSSLVNGDK